MCVQTLVKRALSVRYSLQGGDGVEIRIKRVSSSCWRGESESRSRYEGFVL